MAIVGSFKGSKGGSKRGTVLEEVIDSSGVTSVNSGGVTGELKTGYRGHRAITRYGIAVAVLAR